MRKESNVDLDVLTDVEIAGVSLSVLFARAEENSVRMPSGLTREQRREWAMSRARSHQN